MLLCIFCIEFFFRFLVNFFSTLPSYLYLCCQTLFICFKNFYFSSFYSFFLHTDLSGQYQNLLRLSLWNLVSFVINFEKFYLSSFINNFSYFGGNLFNFLFFFAFGILFSFFCSSDVYMF